MKTLFTFLLVVVGYLLSAQSVARIANKEMNGKAIDVVTIDFQVSQSDMEDILMNSLKANGAPKKGSKNKAFKGVTYYPALNLAMVHHNKMDYYFDVTGNKNSSTVTMFISKGYDNFVNSKDEPSMFDNAKKYLESLNSGVSTHNWKERVEEQEKIVANEQKSQEKATNNITDIQKNITDLQAKLEKAQQDLEAQKAVLAEAQKKLEAIKSENH